MVAITIPGVHLSTTAAPGVKKNELSPFILKLQRCRQPYFNYVSGPPKSVLRIRIHMLLGLPNPDRLVRDPAPDHSIITKIVRKTLIPTVMRLLYDFEKMM